MSTCETHGGRRSSWKQFSGGKMSSEEDRKQKNSGDEKHAIDRRNTYIDGDDAKVRVYHAEHGNERDHGKRHRTDSFKSHADSRDRGRGRTRENEGKHAHRRSLSGNKRDRKAVEVNIFCVVSAPSQDGNAEGALRGIDKGAGRSGGVYTPPFKLAQTMKDVQDKTSVEYQRMTWDALRKSINGLVNKVNASNIKNIIPDLFAENLIRGRGLFGRFCMKSQMTSPGFTDVFAALVAVVNTKLPEVGNLLLQRIILRAQEGI